MINLIFRQRRKRFIYLDCVTNGFQPNSAENS